MGDIEKEMVRELERENREWGGDNWEGGGGGGR